MNDTLVHYLSVLGQGGLDSSNLFDALSPIGRADIADQTSKASSGKAEPEPWWRGVAEWQPT
jgi:hypothetical protein